MFNPNQKRLLALDGGGLMGIISLRILARMEAQLRAASGNPKLVLSDFFDYIGGTSTGAVIGAGLALGHRVEQLHSFYRDFGAEMFSPAAWHEKFFFSHSSAPLRERLKLLIGEETLLELQRSGRLKSLLMIVTRNANTDSPWPISSNPNARYNDLSHPESNLHIPLYQLVRASTAAPSFFRPERVVLGKGDSRREVTFVDGGVTPFNNPANLLFRMATLPPYRLEWPTGEREMMLVSVGCGLAHRALPNLGRKGMNKLELAKDIPGVFIRATTVENDINCRIAGRCVFGGAIDSEIGDLIPAAPIKYDLGRAFLYARYDPDVSNRGLADLGLADVSPQALQLDNVEGMADFERIGETYARRAVDIAGQFAAFMPSLAEPAAGSVAADT